MAMAREELQKRLMDLVVDGFGIYAGKKVAELVKPYTVKYFKEYSDAANKVLISLVDLVLPQIKAMPYVGDWLSLWGRDGVRDVLAVLVDKPAVCYATDANTIVCKNFDTTNVIVKIDGAAKTVNTDYTLSGNPDEFTISLASALSPGAHDLLVAGNRKSFSGKIYV